MRNPQICVFKRVCNLKASCNICIQTFFNCLSFCELPGICVWNFWGSPDVNRSTNTFTFHRALSVANQTCPHRQKLWILQLKYLAFRNNLNTFSRPTFRILIKRLSSVGPTCTCANRGAAIESCGSAEGPRLLEWFESGESLWTLNGGHVFTSLCLWIFLVSVPTSSQRREKSCDICHFWQFKSGDLKFCQIQCQSRQVVTPLLDMAMCSCDWLKRWETSDWLETCSCYTNDKQFGNAHSTVCI